MKKLSTFFAACFLSISLSFGQTTLSVGDISLLWYSDNPTDEFGFITYVDLAANTLIYFSENGANNAGTFDTGEGILLYTVNSAITAGTVVSFSGGGVSGNGTWSGHAGSFSLSSSGDQIFVFQDTDGPGGSTPQTNPTFIFGLNAASRDKTDACDFTDSQQTDSPSALGTPVTFGDAAGTFLALGTGTGCQDENDHLYYNGALSFGSVAAAKASINDPDNWTGSDAVNPPGDYTTARNNIGAAGNLLPVEFISFAAKTNNNQVLLNWQTATELNNEKFVVEHSLDGKAFQAIGEVQGNGTTEEIQQYNFLHEKPSLGFNYYRLKQMDFDGYFEYSKVITAALTSGLTHFGDFYPNPSRNGAAQMEAMAENEGKWTFRIYSLSGQLLRQQAYILNAGQNILTFDFPTLDSGLYIVHLENENERLFKKLMIQ